MFGKNSQENSALATNLTRGLLLTLALLTACSKAIETKPPVETKKPLVPTPIVDQPTQPTNPTTPDNGIADTRKQLFTWIYNDVPACNALNELEQVQPDYVSVDFFDVDSSKPDLLTLRTEEKDGCNAWSPTVVNRINSNSKDQFATVNTDDASVFSNENIGNPTRRAAMIQTLLERIIADDFSGITFDLEGFGGWSKIQYQNYLTLLKEASAVFTANGKKTIVYLPAIYRKELITAYPHFRYADIAKINTITNVFIAAYDQQFEGDYSTGGSNFEFIRGSVEVARQVFSTKALWNKVVVGVHSFGFVEGRSGFITGENMKKVPGFGTATRDPKSGEFIWQTTDPKATGGNWASYSDEKTLQTKADFLESLGMPRFGLYSLGGNALLKK
jgi:spore germination protein YaaH